MRLLPRLMTGWRPARFLEHVPTLLPLTMCCTMEGYPAHELLQYCQEMEKKPGVVDCTVFHGFPYADIDIVGTSVYVATEDSLELAEDIAKQVGAWIWQNRERFRLDVLGAQSAIEAAVASSKGAGTISKLTVGVPHSSLHTNRYRVIGQVCIGRLCSTKRPIIQAVALQATQLTFSVR
jgi:microcystin degradation protein MlrC